VNATSTAKALILFTPFFLLTSPEQRDDVLRRATAHRDFSDLVSSIENVLINDPTGALDYQAHPTMYERAVRIAIDILQAYAQFDGKSEKGAKPWIEEAPTDSVAFMNPNCIYYCSAVYQGDAQSWDDLCLLDAKSSLWSYQWGWPPVYYTPPTRTPYCLGNGSFRIEMTKGFDFSEGISGFFNWSHPSGRATLCNVGKGVIQVYGLIGGIHIIASFSDLTITIPAGVLLEMHQAYSEGDAWKYVIAFTKLIIYPENVESICYWIWQSISSDAAQNFMALAHGILQNVAIVTKAVFMAESGINEAAPFFYDIITAPPSVTYFVTQEDDQLTANEENQPPLTPWIMEAPSSGHVGVQCTFYAVTTDPDGDDIAYRFHWGDGETSAWTAPVSSGSSVSVSHSYDQSGTYSVVAEARDSYGTVTDLSEAHSIVITPVGSFLFEDFNDDIAGGHPTCPPWTTEWLEPSSVRISDRIHYGSSGKSCAFFDFDPAVGDTGGAYAEIYTVIEDEPSGSVEFIWRVENREDYFGLRAWQEGWDWETMAYYVLFMDGHLAYYNDDGEFIPIMSISPATWYRMKLIYNRYYKSYDIYINGSLQVNDAPFRGSPSSINILQIVAFCDAVCNEAHIDDIELSTTTKDMKIGPPPAEALLVGESK
jgi:hypothetical protein